LRIPENTVETAAIEAEKEAKKEPDLRGKRQEIPWNWVHMAIAGYLAAAMILIWIGIKL
jgi:hypothetical protein